MYSQENGSADVLTLKKAIRFLFLDALCRSSIAVFINRFFAHHLLFLFS
jgi:hypothetical protein